MQNEGADQNDLDLNTKARKLQQQSLQKKTT
jgi:hypothetical protein